MCSSSCYFVSSLCFDGFSWPSKPISSQLWVTVCVFFQISAKVLHLPVVELFKQTLFMLCTKKLPAVVSPWQIKTHQRHWITYLSGHMDFFLPCMHHFETLNKLKFVLKIYVVQWLFLIKKKDRSYWQPNTAMKFM